uniref:Uncharacterized protein n=1 Tax=Tanacetum cinerariifolium TaxID=118510 RepID=A0A699HAE7_TANCI|nr:hypothetical protein [Tanacetum cinerariifolium]
MLDWNNLEGDHYPFDLSKPLPLQGHTGHLTVAVDYFFNNDIEYLKSSNLERTYTTLITKTKAARYEIEGIEDMKILGVKSLSVKKLHGYGHLEEIVVKRADHQFCKFKEGDFMDLHLNDIEDMMFLAIQHKLFHLIDSDIIDFIMALRIITRSLTFLEIEFKELYTPSHKPPGVIYEDLTKQKRVMRADELYKFSNRTLKNVQDELHYRIRDFHLEYNKEMSRRKWTAIDIKRLEVMVELTDKQMRERRIIRNVKRLVGARGRIFGNKMHKAFPLPVTEFPLPEELPTAREDSCHRQKKREATARKIALLSMSKRNCQSKVAVTLKVILKLTMECVSILRERIEYDLFSRHLKEETRMIHVVPSVVLLRSWTAP